MPETSTHDDRLEPLRALNDATPLLVATGSRRLAAFLLAALVELAATSITRIRVAGRASTLLKTLSVKIVFKATRDKLAIGNVHDRQLDCPLHRMRSQGEHGEEGKIGE
jgi:hypothetical protein